MSIKKIFAVIDVGGSSLKAYVCSEGKSELVKTQKWKANNQIENTIVQASEFMKKKFECTDIIIGLPGPVDRSKKSVFCPPLNENISLERLHKTASLIVNDVVCQAGILLYSENRKKFDEYNALITIGTSLGLCVFKNHLDIHQALVQARAYEIAHEGVNRYTLESDTHIINSLIGSKVPRLCTLFSVGGLCACMGGVVQIKNEYMITASKSDIAKILGSNVNEGQKTKLELWFKDLKKVCEIYLAEKGLRPDKINFVFSGGIIDAIKESGIDFRLSDYKLAVKGKLN